MAQKVDTYLVDDLDGGPAETTVRFGLDSAQYEIDLSKENEDVLRERLAAFIDAARRLGRDSAPKTAKPPNGDVKVIRAWARERGIQVNDRGRIPSSVVTQYRQATS